MSRFEDRDDEDSVWKRLIAAYEQITLLKQELAKEKKEHALVAGRWENWTREQKSQIKAYIERGINPHMYTTKFHMSLEVDESLYRLGVDYQMHLTEMVHKEIGQELQRKYSKK